MTTLNETFTENGRYTITPYPNSDGFDEVNVNVNVPPQTLPRLQDKTVDVISNGLRLITADNGYDGLNLVTINTDVELPRLNTGEYTFTSNNIYTLTPLLVGMVSIHVLLMLMFLKMLIFRVVKI